MGILVSVCKNCLKYGFDINTPSRTRTTPQQISQPNPLKIEHSRNKSKLKQKVLVIWNLLVWLSHLTLHSRVQMLLLRSRMCFVFPCWDFPWNQTWGTVIFDQIHSWTTCQTPIPEVEFPPCLAAAQSPQKSLFQWMDRGDLVCLMKMPRELSLLKSTKFLLLEWARKKHVDGFIWFLVDLTEIHGEMWFYHSHRNYD